VVHRAQCQVLATRFDEPNEFRRCSIALGEFFLGFANFAPEFRDPPSNGAKELPVVHAAGRVRAPAQ